MATITFLGLGNMGRPMALNLLKAGHELIVYDIVAECVDPLVEAGATKAESLQQSVQRSDWAISMLPASQHVCDVYLGDQGLLQHMQASTTIIDCSTIDAETAVRLAQDASSYDISVMDAPVSGGVAGAVAGTLSFLCGGSEGTFTKAKPILQAMGKNIFHAGDNGAGQLAKMCNNMLLSVLMIGTSEALNLGVAKGLDPKVLSEIMLASSGRNWVLELYNPYPGVMPNSPASNEYRPGFTVDLMCKDLGLAIAAAKIDEINTPLSTLAQQLYNSHQQSGFGGKDFSSILQALK